MNEEFMENRRYHVLIVEDSPEDREIYRRLLTRAGGAEYTFAETHSGAEALRLCRERRPDCVLLDYRLPDSDGLELLPELTAPDPDGPVPVIMLTGQGDEAVAVQAMKRGAQDYLVKGRMTATGLAGAVQNAIEKVELRRRVEKLEEERQRLERRVQEAQRLESLGVLAGGVAHRFNNLLVGVLGNASLAKEMVPPGSPARAALEEIETSAQQAAELCGQMLFFSGRGRFVVGPLDLSAAVEQMKPLLELTAGEDAALHYELAAGLPPIEGDAAQIRQMILNLVTNAVEALTGPGGRITVTTGARRCGREDWAEAHRGEDLPEGMYVSLEVRDTGRGMDPQTLGKIFDPFFTTKFTGRGLGLAAVLGIVRGHRGAIQVASAPGQGTTFRVLLPAAAAAAAPPPGAGRGKAGDRVLVIDDDAMVRGVTAAALRAAGLDVLTASGGREAVEAARAQSGQVGLVLLDLVMPEAGGEETLHELRRLLPGTPVLLVSGCTEKEATARFAGQGLAGFVQKPWRVPDLIERVRRLLG
jgi:signal transduction histidine kinase